jgi:hypothetical protein
MEHKYIIDNKEVTICDKEIRLYYKVCENYYTQEQDQQPEKYEGDLFISEDGKFIDCSDCSKSLKGYLHNETVGSLEVHNNFKTLDGAKGFIYNNKLYLCQMLEEVTELSQ